jgi:predicted nucleotidyltransferase
LDELASLVAAPTSSVHRELSRALAAGLVRRDDRRRPHLFRAAQDSPAYDPLRNLLEVTAGVPQRLADVLSRVAGVQAAAIHGSWASERLRPDSDLDVIVVTEGNRDEARRAVRKFSRTIGREGDVSVINTQDLAELSENPFIQATLRGPLIDVIGDLRELAAGA